MLDFKSCRIVFFKLRFIYSRPAMARKTCMMHWEKLQFLLHFISGIISSYKSSKISPKESKLCLDLLLWFLRDKIYKMKNKFWWLFLNNLKWKKEIKKKKKGSHYFSVGHFWITFGFFLKASPGVCLFIWKWVFIWMWMKTNFHMKGWVPGLALKKRPKVIWKWPILFGATKWQVHYIAHNVAPERLFFTDLSNRILGLKFRWRLVWIWQLIVCSVSFFISLKVKILASCSVVWISENPLGWGLYSIIKNIFLH